MDRVPSKPNEISNTAFKKKYPGPDSEFRIHDAKSQLSPLCICEARMLLLTPAKPMSLLS